MLVEDTMRTCAEYLAVAQREETAEHQAQTFHSLVLRGKLRTAVSWITERKTDGVLQPGGAVYKDRGPGDGGVALQTPGDPDTNHGELRLVSRSPPGADTN